MADPAQHGLPSGGLENEDMLSQHSLPHPSAAEFPEGEVNDDILQQALAEASANNAYYHDTMNANNNAPADTNVNAELYPGVANAGASTSTAIADCNTAEAQAPLGSRDNPIRIIQQGNQYTSMQHLTPEQLTQIMQVLQQQQAARNASQGGGSTVTYQSDNSARVIYRIVYPNDALKSAGGGASARSAAATASGAQSQPSSAGRKIRRRDAHRKRRRATVAGDAWEEVSDGEWVAAESGSDDSRLPGTSLSREEKEERKKHRPRTRSGRVSKPPKHMVKDYKHIHPLDWDEDYDDSDGGYSDFKHSDKDEDGDSKDSMDTSAYSDSRKKVWKCRTCNKSYIGTGGLGRHYRLYPGHGRLEDHSGPTLPDAAASIFMPRSQGIQNELSQDSLSRDTSVSVDGMMTPAGDAVMTQSPHFAANGLPLSGSTLADAAAAFGGDPNVTKRIIKTPGYIPTGRPRGRPPSNPLEIAERRRVRLRDLVRQCDQDDLIEVVLPLLLPSVSCWEFLLMRCEESSRLAAQQQGVRSDGIMDGRQILLQVLREFDDVRSHAAAAAKHCLKQQNSALQAADGARAVQGAPVSIEDEAMARALELEVGVYDAVAELPELSRLRLSTLAAATSAHATPSVMTSTQAMSSISDMVSGNDDNMPGSLQQEAIMTTQAVTSHSADLATSVIVCAQSAAGAVQRPLLQQRSLLTGATFPHHALIEQRGANVHILHQQPAPSDDALHQAIDSQQQQQQIGADDFTHQSMMQSAFVAAASGSSGLALSHSDAAPSDAINADATTSLVEGQLYAMPGGEIVTADGSVVQLPEGASVIQTSDGIVIYHPSVDPTTGTVQFDGGSTMHLESLQGLMVAMDADGNAQLHYVADQATMQ